MSLRCYALLGVLALLPAQTGDRVREAATATYVHGMTAEIAEREAGRESVPALIALLRDPAFSRRDNVVAFLAYLGGAESTAALRRLLDDPPAARPTVEESRARVLVPHALGRIAGRGDPGALDALLDLTAREGPLREASVAALAYARGPAARRRLDEIATAGGRLSGTAHEALGVMAELGEKGGSATPAAEGSPLPAVTYVADPAARSHRHGLSFTNHAGLDSPMSTSRLESLLAEATRRAGRGNFDGDVACCTELVRAGLGATFGSTGDGLDTVDSAPELSTVLSVSNGRAKVVDAINYCGGPGTNIIGCASSPGTGMVLVRLSDLNAESVLWIHEYGHNLGLTHASDSRDLMFASDNGANSGLTTEECAAFHKPSGASSASISDIGACTDDGDSFADPIDNCPNFANESQADANGNGIGDVCEACPGSADSDADGVCNPDDNCPSTANASQEDFDADGFGDACEEGALLADADLSGLVDGVDLARLGRAFGAVTGDGRYDVRVDYDRDGQVDGTDLSRLASQFGDPSF
jgi:predicted Zn-dependent protease/general stress protein YciG